MIAFTLYRQLFPTSHDGPYIAVSSATTSAVYLCLTKTYPQKIQAVRRAGLSDRLLAVDFAEVQTEEGKHYLFVAIDRTSKVAFAELHPRATKLITADFLRRVLKNLPYKVHKVLTDNGTQFGNMPHQPQAGWHIFERVRYRIPLHRARTSLDQRPAGRLMA